MGEKGGNKAEMHNTDTVCGNKRGSIETVSVHVCSGQGDVKDAVRLTPPSLAAAFPNKATIGVSVTNIHHCHQHLGDEKLFS